MYRSPVSCMTRVCEVDGHNIVHNDRLLYYTRQNSRWHQNTRRALSKTGSRLSKVVFSKRWFSSTDSYITY